MRHAAHVDDHAELVGEHVRQHGLHGVESAFDIQVEGLVQKSVVDFEKLCTSYCGAGRVEQELHAAESVDGKLDHIVNGGAFVRGDIDGQCQRLTADGVNFLGGLFHRLKEAIQKKEDTETESEPLPKVETLSEEQIKELALKQVNGIIDSLQLVKEGDQQVYQVIVSDQTAKNKLSLDAYTGDVLKRESSAIEVAPKRLTEEQAKNAALKEVPGKVDDIEAQK